jgi:GT2 family glycosyltransferase
MSHPYIDILLLSYGKFSTTTKPCLDSLLQDSNNENYRLTVIDNHSPDDSAERIRGYLKDQPQVRTAYLKTNTGFGGGMNHGASLATAEWLLLVNSDTVFAPGALGALYHALAAQPTEIGMMGPITNAAGNDQGYDIPGDLNAAMKVAVTLQNNPIHTPIPSYRLDFFCVAIRKSLWDKLHGLDPIFGLGYYEDTDFSMRAKAIGCQMMICEDAFVYHMGGSSFSANPKAKALIKRNKKIFLKRHPNATLYHQREGNLQAIQEYLLLNKLGKWNEGYELRLKMRMAALRKNQPRSFLKRWLWQLKVHKVICGFKFEVQRLT